MAEHGDGFSAEEKAAMKERARETRTKRTADEDAAEVLAKIAELEGDEREIAQRLHDIVAEVAPDLTPKTWYGMPSYARNGKSVVFFQSASKFKSRYSTIGFNDPAALDEGSMWPTAYAITSMTEANARRIAQLVKQAAG